MKHSVVAIGVAVLTLCVDATAVAQIPRAAIIVHNRARIPDALVSDARNLVDRVYRDAGIDLQWFSVKPGLRQVRFSGVKLRLMIITQRAAEALTYPNDAVAFTPGGGRGGTLAYVLDHRVRAVARGYGVRTAVVLAAAMAHELGHMLLKGGHTASGIMRAAFTQTDLRRFGSGELSFNASAAMELRAGLIGFPVNVRAAATVP